MKTIANPSPVEDLEEHMLWTGFDRISSITQPLSSTTYFFDRIPIEITYTKKFGDILSRLNITSYQGRERELFTKMLDAVPKPGDHIEMFGFTITRTRDQNGRHGLLIAN